MHLGVGTVVQKLRLWRLCCYLVLGLMMMPLTQIGIAQEAQGTVSVTLVGNVNAGRVTEMSDVPGGGALVGAEKGLFLAREVDGRVTVTPVGNVNVSTGSWMHMRKLPGAGVLIHTDYR